MRESLSFVILYKGFPSHNYYFRLENDMPRRFRAFTLFGSASVAALLALSLAGPAAAQSGTGGGAAGTETQTPASAAPQTPRSTASSTKAQRKLARKQRRAVKNAQLKKLEDNGYQPGQEDPNYPQNLQDAQKKAGMGAGASQ
jgi:hypothetical protein